MEYYPFITHLNLLGYDILGPVYLNNRGDTTAQPRFPYTKKNDQLYYI